MRLYSESIAISLADPNVWSLRLLKFLGDLNLFGSIIYVVIVECVVLVECKHCVLHTISSVWISDYSYNTGTELNGWSMHMVGCHIHTLHVALFISHANFSLWLWVKIWAEIWEQGYAAYSMCLVEIVCIHGRLKAFSDVMPWVCVACWAKTWHTPHSKKIELGPVWPCHRANFQSDWSSSCQETVWNARGLWEYFM